MNVPLCVNGVTISEAAIEREMAMHEGDPAPREAARRALAIRELLLQRAREIGLAALGAPGDGSVTEDELIDLLLTREVAVPQPTEEECRRYYEANAARFRTGDLIEASHILFAVTPGAPLNEIRATAEATLKAVISDPARFAELAASHSNCPSGAQGGNLGQLRRGETVPEFESALFDGAATGVLPRLISTRYGFHVVHVARRIEGRLLPFEMVQQRIAEYLEDKVRHTAYRQYVQILAGGAQVSGVDLNAAASPLVR
jgi:peptidyl-prolyl cis-trans isomerase C